MNFNRVILAGNLTGDPELHQSPDKKPYCDFILAVNERYKVGEDSKETVHFFACRAFGKTAEVCKDHLKKGSGLLLEGTLRQERWEERGVKRSRILVIAQNVQFAPGKRSHEGDRFDA